MDGVGNLDVADTSNHTIRKITIAGVVTTFAGLASSRASMDGAGSGARFSSPYGVAVDGVGNLYVSDSNNCTGQKNYEDRGDNHDCGFAWKVRHCRWHGTGGARSEALMTGADYL